MEVFMAAGSSRRDEIREENKKMKHMTFSQKIEHIWEYYKKQIIAPFIVIILAISIANGISKNNYEAVCTTIVIDGYMTGFNNHTDALTTGFTEYLGIDGKKQRVIFNNNFSLIEKEGDTDAVDSNEKIVAMAATNSIDGFLASRDYIDFYSGDDELFITDLSDYFTIKQLSLLGDNVIYYTMEDGSKIPIAVDLSSTKVATETDLYMTQPCFGIVTTSLHKDNAVSFIKYAFDME